MTDVFGPHRVVPVVVLDDPGRADDLGAALAAGGLPVAEVTFRSPDAPAVLRRMADREDLVVGAGTVLTAEQVDLAHRSGARFVVSPGLGPDVVRRCQQLDLPVLPGVSTATEVMQALSLGVDLVKFFPAEPSGGLPAVSALADAFRQVRFVPTGGITAARAPDYLAHPAVAAVGGTWMVPPALLKAGRWEEVAALCAAAVAATAADPVVVPVTS
ncbi:bifunctional 4-hydroxy-2-oxoglutarate aldolase/2-dehydro-3-deoxy-phosphogluconate aldolase [Nocardioides humi]|uniref:2-dehydro-3-deoxy-phosphogluconate aldolase n=1 Tax=Nocardioides humi TaxID=449461 RepID=A0ABN2AAL8_9ACTN|nr:bifunctional 4-hydroxy-2-oxoglutarate aldolase/2-dehydro-3-deoxy-phosphogluconate aldolase [Nocardioides humi]